MGKNLQDLFGGDPDVLRYQLAQQEAQRYQKYTDPRMELAARQGAMLGGGVNALAGLITGRPFNNENPILQKASDIQNIYNQTAQSIDPNTSPADFYKALQGNLAKAGHGYQAAMAGQEWYKYSQAEKEYKLKERDVAAREKQASPFSQGQLVTDEPGGGRPLSFDKATGKYYTNDGKEWTGSVKSPTDKSLLNQLNKGAGGGAKDGKGGNPPLTKEEKEKIWKDKDKPIVPPIVPQTNWTPQTPEPPKRKWNGKSYEITPEWLAWDAGRQQFLKNQESYVAP